MKAARRNSFEALTGIRINDRGESVLACGKALRRMGMSSHEPALALRFPATHTPDIAKEKRGIAGAAPPVTISDSNDLFDVMIEY